MISMKGPEKFNDTRQIILEKSFKVSIWHLLKDLKFS